MGDTELLKPAADLLMHIPGLCHTHVTYLKMGFEMETVTIELPQMDMVHPFDTGQLPDCRLDLIQ